MKILNYMMVPEKHWFTCVDFFIVDTYNYLHTHTLPVRLESLCIFHFLQFPLHKRRSNILANSELEWEKDRERVIDWDIETKWEIVLNLIKIVAS